MSMAALLEEDEDSWLAHNQGRVLMNRPSLNRRRSRSLENLPLAADSALPSQGTPGYTSLTLPRAPPPPFLPVSSKKSGLSDGKIDLTVSGIAQTTMATVEVVHGLGSQSSKGLLGMFSRRRTVSSKSMTDGGLAFTSYRKPPDYIPGNSVLVQVWAAGVDETDSRLLGTASGASGLDRRTSLIRSASVRSRRSVSEHSDGKDSIPKVGFIPGRSFVGRVLECGWDVGDDIVKKGDWVIGLLDMKKCGALQQFIVVERHRLHRIPYPVSPSEKNVSRRRPPSSRQSTVSGTSSPRRGPSYSRYPHLPPSHPMPHPRSSPVVPTGPSLSVEEFALLPLCGISAYRAFRALTYAFSDRTNTTNDPLPRRVLVLRGHQGAGAMIVQILAKSGWRVSAHATLPLFQDDKEGLLEEAAYMKSVQDRIRSWGAEEVIFDDGGQDEDRTLRLDDRGDEGKGAILRVIQRLVEDGDAFDAVVDTVGGKEIWDASERLLKGIHVRESQKTTTVRGHKTKKPKTMGQFVTLVGDFPGRPIPSAGDLFKGGLRSLKHTHKGSDQSKDGVGYIWINNAQDVDWEGEDVRDSLASVINMALKRGIQPFIPEKAREERVVPFECAPRIFNSDLGHGAVTVVKVVG